MAKQVLLTDRQTAAFCRGLSLQLHAGISLADGIYLLAEGEQGSTRQILLQMGKNLDQGALLSDALEQADCFSEYVKSMVKIGQQTGKLEQTLRSLGDFYEQRSIQKRQIKNALTYPAMIFVLMLVVVSVLLIQVLPVFEGVYESLGSRLTGMAAGLLYLGQLLKGALPVLLAALVLVLLIALAYWKLAGFREKVNCWFRSQFGDKGVARKFNNARFAQALAMGLTSGLPLDASMELAGELLRPIPGAVARGGACAEALEKGESLADAMGKAQLLPPAESRMLAVGLRSGSGDRVMEEIAERFSRQAEEALEDAVGRIEPVMVLISSLLVGLILLSVMLPLMNIMSTIG